MSEAVFNAGLRKYAADGEAWKPEWICFYFINDSAPPSFVVDVSEFFEDWHRALSAHKSQFSNPEKPRPASGPASILDWFEVYARRDAFTIGARYAQAYYSTTALKIGDPMMLVKDIVPRP